MSENQTTVLIIDDQPDFLDTIAERVELKGFKVLKAKDGEEALKMCAQEDFQLAVVDYKLPDIDGLELITKLKTEKPEVETVLLTAYGDDKLREATTALNSAYGEKQDMHTFWKYLDALSQKPTALLVDDDAAFLETISQRMELKGFNVLTAETAEEALETVRSKEVHFAVVDLKLPDMDGLVLITRLKAEKPDIQTMLLTAYGAEKVKMATEAINTSYHEKQNMGSFWAAVKRWSMSVEKHMAAIGMATGGDLDSARQIEDEKDKE
jgi:ActR/RegA family two-component response regulator